MKRIAIIGLAIGLLAGCSAPQPKVPDEGNRVPVNKTVPDELKGNIDLKWMLNDEQ